MAKDLTWEFSVFRLRLKDGGMVPLKEELLAFTNYVQSSLITQQIVERSDRS